MFLLLATRLGAEPHAKEHLQPLCVVTLFSGGRTDPPPSSSFSLVRTRTKWTRSQNSPSSTRGMAGHGQAPSLVAVLGSDKASPCHRQEWKVTTGL